jgi:tRNA-2-methylthio-N6-dimethylallyladenosine synthase
MNVSDTQRIAGELTRMGFVFTDDVKDADLVIMNTCAVRENAENRAFGNIGHLRHIKDRNPDLIIAVCGCMTKLQDVREKIKRSYPQVDFMFGPDEIGNLPQLLYGIEFDAEAVPYYDRPGRGLVPVMYGCNNFCSYCIVPYTRGRERSRAPEEIIAEVKTLVMDGHNEIMLLGQNVNSYGNDRDDYPSFSQLLRQVNAVDGEFKITFMTSHPKDASHELIDTVLECEKIEKHLHLPLQSGNDDILNAMNRGYTVQQYLDTVNYARNKFPDFSFGTDIIVGFPNETYEQFACTLKMLETVKFSNVFSFIYSKRTGTKAAETDDKITAEEKSRRMTQLLELQKKIAKEKEKMSVSQVKETVELNTDGNDLEQAVRKVGRLIQADERYKAFSRASANSDADADLQCMLGEFSLKRAQLGREVSKPEKDSEKIEEIDTEIKELYSHIMASETMIAYNMAKQEFDAMLNTVTGIISMSASGEDPDTCVPSVQGCGGSCAGCSSSCGQ